MQAPQTLRKPVNWQDFETLCMKLWGEIWNCPEIKKNGRIGQGQHGVDVYGVPSGESGYYGIQCKGKDEYTGKQFTQAEIDIEIEKAKLFKPSLKKLYFATTAVKDAVIEEYVREKNLEHRMAGIFEVHLYSWEDIVDQIDENKHTHDWYVKNQNYKSLQAVEVTFWDGSKEVTLYPQFKQDRLVYSTIDFEAMLPSGIAAIIKSPFLTHKNFIGQKDPEFSPTINKSFVKFFVRIHNTGKAPIEDYKLSLKLKGNIKKIAHSNRKEGILSLNFQQRSFNTHLSKEDMTITVSPLKSLLVGDDTFTSEDIFVKPHSDETHIEIEWKLISRDYKAEGVLIINLKSEIKQNRKFIKIEDSSEERTEYGEIEDDIIIAGEDQGD